jgi:ssDNA thymidine ADP-ribosyltransferase DarT-like protein
MDAHCPVPIFLLFDSAEILTRRETLFSARTLARRGGTFEDSAESFVNLPFDKIYHNAWLEDEEKADIIACRHAEVILPGNLDLSSLKFIWCRSQAEKSTLLHLIGGDARRRWADKIFEGKKSDLFYTRWTFVERADLSEADMVFFFNPSTETPGPFRLKVTVSIAGADTPICYEDDQFIANSRLALQFKTRQEGYTVQLALDGCVAYESAFAERAAVL